MDRTLDYDRLLLPTFMIKDTGSMPDVAATPTLSNLRVDNINLVFHMPDYENKNGFYKPRNKDLLGPLTAASGSPAIITGAAGSGKTTLILNAVLDGTLTDTVFCSPTHLLRLDALKKGFTQTMCHARLLGGRVFTEERTRDLNRRPPANIIVDEAIFKGQGVILLSLNLCAAHMEATAEASTHP
ncbi:hypothetical protein T492DRAFT_1124008 [Pavlovales sp. CCMP2436]|nr:hypothetical protein T492DRAFT_1124008 [Pavlovales sp. CCMP2436]